jgi:peptide chain release factor 1
LAFTENKYDELTVKISDPSIMANQNEWRKLCKEHAELEILVNVYREYKKVIEDLKANKEMLTEENDKEMREMLQEEISELSSRQTQLEEEIQILLLPKDPNDDKSVMLKLEVVQVGKKQHYFQQIYLECILDMLKTIDGRLKL